MNTILRISSCILILVILSGCGSTKASRFYVLSPVQESGITQAETKLPDQRAIGVGPIVFPDILERPQIVTRLSPNEIQLAEFDRWGGSFKDNFLRTFVENLCVDFPDDRVYVHPWKGTSKVDYQITLDARRFDGMIPGYVHLVVSWIVRRSSDNQESQQLSRFSQPVAGSTYGAYVSAQSLAVADLSRAIVNAIRTMETGSSTSSNTTQ